MENFNSLASPELVAVIGKYSRFIGEIRKKILLTLIVFALATIIGFVFYEQIIRFLVGLLSLQGVNIVFTSPFQFINLAISCGVATGLIVAFPFILIQLLAFLKPALKEKEFKAITTLLPFSLFLFVAGFIFGVLIMKWQIGIFLDRSVSLGIGNILDISGLLNVVLITSVLMGVGFQFPIVILLLLKIGVVKKRKLIEIRPWVYLASFIFAVLLPPDSIIADILLSLPLIFLYEFTLMLSKS